MRKKAKHEKIPTLDLSQSNRCYKAINFFSGILQPICIMSYTTHYLKQKEAAGRSRTVDGEYLCLTIWVLSPGMSNTISILLTTKPHCSTSTNRRHRLYLTGLILRLKSVEIIENIFEAVPYPDKNPSML